MNPSTTAHHFAGPHTLVPLPRWPSRVVARHHEIAGTEREAFPARPGPGVGRHRGAPHRTGAAEPPSVPRNTATNPVPTLGKLVSNDGSTRFGAGQGSGVDEHVSRPTRHGNKYVTDRMGRRPVRGKTGPHRLLKTVEGRSKILPI